MGGVFTAIISHAVKIAKTPATCRNAEKDDEIAPSHCPIAASAAETLLR
jgi:hypothetical protein